MKHLEFFGFTEDPFRLTPDRDFFFPAAGHTAMADAVRFGIDQGDGFIVVLGEVGAGKTMLMRMLLSEMGPQFVTALLLSPQLTPRQLVQSILCDIGFPEKSLARATLDRLLRALNDYLFKLSEQNRKLLVVVDEAQDLNDDSIEQLRLLSNFESDKSKWLQIVLFGQPELDKKLAQPHLRQLRQRVGVMETLPPLNEKETGLYVNFRFSRAGRGDMRLESAARRELFSRTGGLPRLINKTMGRALLVACANGGELHRKAIREAAESLRLKQQRGLGAGLRRLFKRQ